MEADTERLFSGEERGVTYKRIRNLAVFGLALLLSMSLSGCSFSFLGFRLGKSEEFVFYCTEDVEGDAGGSVSLGDGGESRAASTGVSAAESLNEGTELAEDMAGAQDGVGDTTTASPASISQSVSDGESGDTRVNINTADREELMSLNGIGESRADAIIEYRTQNGSFTSAEQIMEVSGIAEGIYAKIKDQIRVQ